jgi:hypothetical protein
MTQKNPIYMDNAATTRTDPRVVEAMLPYFTEKYGNAASRNHKFGWDAEDAIEHAREQAAALIGADAKEIIWTSGSTESNNLAIKGAAHMYAKTPGENGATGKGHIITALHEHKAVLDPCKRLQREGFDVTFLQPPADGVITRAMVEEAMRPDTILVSIMWANNEIGTINEVPEIGALCHERDVIFHTDATQWVGKMPTDVEKRQHRSALLVGPQDLRPEGRRRALRPPPQAARASRGAHRRRRPRARHAFGHAERDRHRRLRQGVRTLHEGDGDGARPPLQAPPQARDRAVGPPRSACRSTATPTGASRT